MDADSKKCPFCAKLIEAEAVLCRYCHSKLEADPPTPSANTEAPLQSEPQESKRAKVNQPWNPVQYFFTILLSLLVLFMAACIGKAVVQSFYAQRAKEKQLEKQLGPDMKTILNRQLEIANKGGIPSKSKDANQWLAMMEKMAEKMEPEDREKFMKMAQSGRLYRQKAQELNDLGGMAPKTFKSRQDLIERLHLLQQAEDAFMEWSSYMPENESTKIDLQVIQILKRRGYFFRRHWGQWSYNQAGEIVGDFPQADLHTLNNDDALLKTLKLKAVEFLKNNANDQLQKLNQLQ